MYKALIADDEVWIRRGIKEMTNWKALGLQLAGEAGNGQMAFDMALDCSPDILITDVRMPHMDGLTLSEKLLKHFPDLKIVIISGYEDFAYIKRAMNMEAFSYLIKPIDKDELNAVLGKCTDAIAEQRGNEKLKESIPLVWEKLVIDCVLHGGSEHARRLEEWLAWNRINGKKYRIGVFEYDKRKYDSHAIRSIILRSCDEAGGQDVRLIAFLMEEGKAGLLVVGKSDDQGIHFGLRRLVLAIKQEMDFRLSIGDAVDGLERLRSSYSQAVEALDNRNVSGRDELIWFSKEDSDRTFKYPLQFQDSLISSIVTNRRDKLDEAFVELERYFSDTSGISVRDAKNIFLKVVSDIVRTLLQQDDFPGDIVEEGFEFCRAINRHADLHSMRDWLYGYCEKIICARQNSNDSDITRIIHDVVHYINEHFSETVSLNKISATYHVNASYFSHQFKEKTGETYMAYLTGVRMEKAKAYLADSQIKIGLIGRMVGYEDGRYFSRLFKSYTGKTPSKFRAEVIGRGH